MGAFFVPYFKLDFRFSQNINMASTPDVYSKKILK